ncbi:hypothetical protein [Streptomyces lonarensis]|uniref:Uncharacterized protein n=1 Tax=Streptomyces lonarensis TaxID=700599 RepID=A0A7X6CWY2_9ACTN|nr:hypothetical protein [Streptomyces lonarensis]NJQ04119.1 hypothetical protein [Streptomyces lonarensis]
MRNGLVVPVAGGRQMSGTRQADFGGRRRDRSADAERRRLRRTLAGRYRKLTGEDPELRWLSPAATTRVSRSWERPGADGEFSLTALGDPGPSVWLPSHGGGPVAGLHPGNDPEQSVTLLFRHYRHTGAAVVPLRIALARGVPLACADEDGFVAVLSGGSAALSVDCDQRLDTVEVQLWGTAPQMLTLPAPDVG